MTIYVIGVLGVSALEYTPYLGFWNAIGKGIIWPALLAIGAISK